MSILKVFNTTRCIPASYQMQAVQASRFRQDPATLAYVLPLADKSLAGE